MIGRALFASLLWCLGCGLALAQDQTPLITSELSSDQAIVGQPLVLRVKILVPTWMLTPPQYSSLEQPNLLIRLPERASTPTSETINGETWSGIIRSYRIYPLAPGRFEIPKRTLTITYADPATSQPIVLEQVLAAVSFTGTMPAASRGLNPPVLAKDFQLNQTINAPPEITIGDAITRIVTATIDGTTPILIPLLIPPFVGETLRDYPKEADVTEHEDRDSLSGSRRETVTYIAQADGQVSLPPIVLDWFNVETGKIEQAKVDGLDLAILAAPVAPLTLSPQLLARYAALGLFATLSLWLAAWLLMRFVLPVVHTRVQAARLAFRASEPYAYRQLNRAIDARALDRVLTGLDRWRQFYPDVAAADLQGITQGLHNIGQAQFGGLSRTADAAPHSSWHDLKHSSHMARKALRKRQKAALADRSLPPLNPEV